MLEFFKKLFDSADWPPRWHCGHWTEFHGWLYIISDLLIWSAYFAIPLVIIRYLSKKNHPQFIRLYFLFAAFILACGTTHFLDAVAFWIPLYRLNALMRFITGIISWITVFYLIRYLPIAFSLKSFQDFETELENRKAAEQKVVLLNIELDKQIKQSSAELKAYKYALDESSIVSMTDERGLITYINDNFSKISKYSREELIGNTHSIISSGFHSKAYCKKLWTTITNGDIWKGEFNNRTKDGHLYWEEMTIIPFLDNVGNPSKFMAISSDITSKKVIDEAYYRSQHIYKTIASNIPGSIICIFDAEYRYILVEGDMLQEYGLTKEILLGKQINDALSGDLFALLNRNLQRVFQGEAFRTESTINDKILMTRYVPLKDMHGKVFNAMLVALDITALKKAQTDIEELNENLETVIQLQTEQLKEMEAFTYSVSHDLRAPLRAVSGYARILSEDYSMVLDREGNRLIDSIVLNSRKMGQLIDDLLNFSRIGRKEVHLAVVNMEKTVNACINELMQDTQQKVIDIFVDSLPNAKGDPAMLKQVWMNLISNSLKYSSQKENQIIRIGYKIINGDTVYYIQDNGVGFDMAYADKLFGIFQRLHSEEEFEGTGVGLALVERILRKHNGKVWGKGSVGDGATFFFTLPTF